MGRKPCCDKVGLNRGGWSALEDQILASYIKANGEGKWRDLPKEAGLKRCGKSCRLRWLNYLNPNIIRGNITPEEEELIITLHKQLGNRWSLIAGRLPGRTDNEIKNYWNTILGKKVHGVHVVPKRKPRKPTDEKKCNSSSVPRRRTVTVQKPGGASLISSERCPGHVVTLQDSSTELICDIMQNMVNNEVSDSQVYEECYSSDQLIPSLNNSTDVISDVLQSIAAIESPELVSSQDNQMPNPVVSGYTPQQLVPSQENRTEFIGDILPNIAYSEVEEECYTQQQQGSSQENNMEFMDEIMQEIDSFQSSQNQVYGKWYHDLMLDLTSEDNCVPDKDGYSSMYTSEDIFSELTFTSDESMSDQWVANSYAEHNNAFDFGSFPTVSEFK